MRDISIVAVFWEDPIKCNRSKIPKNPDTLFDRPMLSVGFLMSETEKSVLLLQNIQAYAYGDEADFIAILKSSIVSMKEFGKLPLDIETEDGD